MSHSSDSKYGGGEAFAHGAAHSGKSSEEDSKADAGGNDWIDVRRIEVTPNVCQLEEPLSLHVEFDLLRPMPATGGYWAITVGRKGANPAIAVPTEDRPSCRELSSMARMRAVCAKSCKGRFDGSMHERMNG